MPANPTWQQVADIAAKVDGAEPGMKGICLRGQPGWGQIFAPLTTVVNTFGGTWFDKDWTPRSTPRRSRTADELLRRPGPGARREGRAAGRLHRVPQQPRPGQRRHVVRRDVGRRLARGRRTPRSRARSATPPAPVVKTTSSGWLYAWAWGIQKASTKKDNAWKFISWASRQGVREARRHQSSAGPASRPASAPRPTRTPTTSRSPRRSRSRPRRRSSRPTRTTRACSRGRRSASSSSTSPSSPTSAPRCRQDVSSAIAGKMTVDEALDKGQELAEDVAERYQLARRASA